MKRRILFLGQKKLGEDCFDVLQSPSISGLNVIAAVSNPSVQNVWWKSNRIYQQCLNSGIPFISNEQRNNDEIAVLIKRLKIDTLISVQHQWILPNSVLEMVGGESYNLHNAKLPEYKGYNTFNHAILNKEDFYTSTIHRMSSIVDMGDIVFEETFSINKNETAKSLYDKAQVAAVDIFKKFINLVSSRNDIVGRKLTEEGTYYSRKALEDFREIKNISDIEEAYLKARAFHFPPFEGAYFVKDGGKKYVTPKEVMDGKL